MVRTKVCLGKGKKITNDKFLILLYICSNKSNLSPLGEAFKEEYIIHNNMHNVLC